MLILGRNQGETIVIICPTGEKITIGFHKKRSAKAIALAIEAPRHIKVLRGELYEEIENTPPEQRNPTS